MSIGQGLVGSTVLNKIYPVAIGKKRYAGTIPWTFTITFKIHTFIIEVTK